jgi:meso-butanediol dehydrogenase/(S,S)-butanediol dehydrogenase/diacetyl reductase
MKTLENRVAIVTGAGSGIGRAVAIAFADAGARVAVADLRREPKVGRYHDIEPQAPTDQVILEAGGEALFVGTDVTDDSQVEALISATVARFGGVDILVNNAGVHVPGGIEALSIEDWDRVTRTNFRSLFVATRTALPHLKRSPYGRVIHMASVHAFGGGGGPAYAPAKAGVVNMARDTALEVAKYGITVNAICPGYIETPLQDYLTPEQIEFCRERTPLPRLGRPADIAHAALFLASDAAEWITGIALVVDGGWRSPV